MKWQLIILVPILVSCGATTVVDYDPTADFSQYKTYNSYPTLDTGLSELDDKRILRLTDSIMQLKGYTKSESPQLFINFYASEQLDRNRSTIGIGVGGGGRNGGVGVSGGIPIGRNTVDQKFTLDIIEVQEDALIWQGIMHRNYPQQATPEQMDQHYEKILWALFSKFPPDSQ